MSDFVFNGSVIVSYSGTASSVVIPEGVTGIAAEAFRRNRALTSIAMAKSVEIIGEGAFNGCENLERVSLWSGVKEIYREAFANCRSLREMNIPRHLEKLGAFAFYNCRGLKSVTLPRTLEELGKSAFEACRGLTQLTVSEGVTALPERAFYGCPSLSAVNLPEGLTTIGVECFSGCRKLDGTVFPHSLTLINRQAFFDCVGLSSLKITNPSMIIGPGAFAGCVSLKEVSLPEEGCRISSKAFKDCIGLRDDRGLVTVNGTVFSYYGAEAYYEVPDGIKEIGDEAFDGCATIHRIDLPDTVRRIGENAFRGCVNLKSINIPFSLKRIASTAFDGCCPEKLIMPDDSQVALRDIGMLRFLNLNGEPFFDFDALAENIWQFPESSVKRDILLELFDRREFLEDSSVEKCEDLMMRYSVYIDDAKSVCALLEDGGRYIDPACYAALAAHYSSAEASAAILKHLAARGKEVYELKEDIMIPGKCCVMVIFDNMETVKCNSSVQVHVGDSVEADGKYENIRGRVVQIVNGSQKSRYRLPDILRAYRISYTADMEL
ncbi:MAG: leucine-rich repeat domain-containing protein [Eubacteriales bacterium]|nr:leucine-rich repeat domain-containing protein [Eubacteriales bacterium]